MNKSKTGIFIEKAKKVHGNRYDYSLVEYVSSNLKVRILCKEHGEFSQRACSHTSGQGCLRCTNEIKTKTLESFIREARGVHGDRYSYGDSTYINMDTKLNITCGKHGVFRQKPLSHLSGNGCAKCAHEYRVSIIRKTRVGFIEEANQVHAGNYIYSDVKYVNSNEKVIITCKVHGSFLKRPSDHLGGQGCPLCIWGRDRPTRVYVLSGGGATKVGVSINPEMRLKQLLRNQPFDATIHNSWVLPNYTSALTVERIVHGELSGLSAGFQGFDGYSEWFKCTPEYASEVIRGVIKEESPN